MRVEELSKLNEASSHKHGEGNAVQALPKFRAAALQWQMTGSQDWQGFEAYGSYYGNTNAGDPIKNKILQRTGGKGTTGKGSFGIGISFSVYIPLIWSSMDFSANSPGGGNLLNLLS